MILRTIRRYHREGYDLCYSAMSRRHQGLVSASSHYYGSYRNAVKTAGIDYDRLRKKPRWDRQKVIAVIRRAARLNVDLNWASVSVRQDDFGHAAKAAIRERLFGSWSDALKAAGLDPDRVALYRHWTQAQIISEMRRRRRAGLPLNSKAMQMQMPGLYCAAARRFGSYEEALRRSGADLDEVVQRRRWDKAAVKSQLKQFESRYGVVSQATLRRYDSGLLRAVRIWFGDLPSAIEAARVESYSIRGHRLNGEADRRLLASPGYRARAKSKRAR